MRILQAGAIYFALVFATGFVLGPLRILLLAPRLGTRMAELLELPVMLAACFCAARWVVRRYALPAAAALRLKVGFLALLLLLTAEFSLVLSLRGMTFQDYLASRDPVSGSAYYASLLVFALLPWWLGRQR